jgi:hypothetical protein
VWALNRRGDEEVGLDTARAHGWAARRALRCVRLLLRARLPARQYFVFIHFLFFIFSFICLIIPPFGLRKIEISLSKKTNNFKFNKIYLKISVFL